MIILLFDQLLVAFVTKNWCMDLQCEGKSHLIWIWNKHKWNFNIVTISSGSLVESVERTTAPHERNSSERGGMERGEAPAAAEAQNWSGWVRCWSGRLDEAASFQTATNFTGTRRQIAASAIEAVAPSTHNTGFKCTAASPFTSTGHRHC